MKMGFFHLFTKKKITGCVHGRNSTWHTATLAAMRTDIDQLRSRLHTIDIALEKHEGQLKSHQVQLAGHQQHIQSLEQTLTETPARAGRLSPGVKEAHPRIESAAAGPAQQFDIGRFTEQQKRILGVFFQNKGVRMSYADVAAALNKSAYTVKNQLNQIRRKADLFDCSIGDQSRKLFALKGDLRIEKYLHLGRPFDQPVSILQPDPSHGQSAKAVQSPGPAKPE